MRLCKTAQVYFSILGIDVDYQAFYLIHFLGAVVLIVCRSARSLVGLPQLLDVRRRKRPITSCGQ